MNSGRLLIILVHALIGWALCAATMGIGMATTSLQNALIVHAIGAPIIFPSFPWFISEDSTLEIHEEEHPWQNHSMQ
jgi:hypothetical protein